MSARERIVYEEMEPCPYIEGETSLMPLRWQLWRLNPSELCGDAVFCPATAVALVVSVSPTDIISPETEPLKRLCNAAI